MDVRLGQAKEEAELKDGRNSTCTASFDRQPDEASDQELAARERRCFPLDVEQLRCIHISYWLALLLAVCHLTK